ncbi:kinase-like domain-containing protein [Xylaria arbuscula]|nr:kinase-like domain-containing protein [Xylaria arbuscula]
MYGYTPIALPFFAPSHRLQGHPLPTLMEVLASTDFLVPPPNDGVKQMCCARVGTHFVAKYGEDVRSIEGESMLFVQQYTTIPVPEVYAIYTFGEGNTKTMIIMEFIQGITLGKFIDTMAPQYIDIIRGMLREQVDQLRRIPAPNYYGSIGYRPFYDWHQGYQYGPFNNITDYINEAFDVIFPPFNNQRFDDLKAHRTAYFEWVVTTHGHGHPVFSHGDLHEQNVIIRWDGTPCIIDWEDAGFYPAYHEFLMTRLLECPLDFLGEEFPMESIIYFETREAWQEAENEDYIERLG